MAPEARRQRILNFLLETSPQKKQQLQQESRLTEARAALRRVLAGRQLTPSKDDGGGRSGIIFEDREW